MKIYLSTAYLGPIQYYSKFLSGHGNDVYIENCENYVKQSYRNRCTIISANGPVSLSIPVEHRSGMKIPIRDVQISDQGNWQHIHWNAIVSAYNSSPFFEYFQDDFFPFYHKKFKFLHDYTEQLRELLFSLLGIDDLQVTHTQSYKCVFDKEDEVNCRDAFSPKKNCRETDRSFLPVKYYQVFESKFGFIENSSIIDLLFNMGNESRLVLMNSNR